MRGVLYYFSGTGNTKWIADRFKESFKKSNFFLELRAIEELDEFNIDGFDFLIVGTPVYAETEPKIIDNFIERLPNNNLKTIVYATQGGKSSSAPYIVSKKLKKKGYNVIIQAAVQMPNNYFFAVGKKLDKEHIENIMKKSQEKVNELVNSFIKNKKIKECNSCIRIVIGSICSRGFKNFIPKLSKNIIATDECNKCGLCLRNCPKSNITFENGKANIHSNCIMCLRCIHICPLNAIRYKGKKVNQTQKDIIKSLNLK